MRALVAVVLFASPLLAQTAATPEAARAAYEKKDYATCGDLFAQLAKDDKGSRYNAAVCYSLAGNLDSAFGMLDAMVKDGWVNTDRLRSDDDFTPLHDDKRWTDLLAQAEANWKKRFGNDNQELWQIRRGDAADRSDPKVDLQAAIQRDHERLARVKEIVAAGQLKTANDYFMAAMIFQHGSAAEDYQKARELALDSAKLDPQNKQATWLAAAAQDRYLWKVGKPQIYGTQFHQVNGVWTIEPIDESAVTDEERAKWNVPPLADAKKRAEAMNAKKP